MKNICQDIIVIGAARKEGRAPSHDGEYLTVFYVPGEDDYIVEDNGGLAWTSYGETDVVSDAPDEEQEYMQSLVDDARRIVSQNTGSPARSMGFAAIDIAIQWGWATKDDFDSNHIVGEVLGKS
ncbi:MAG: hypothetical protein K6T65_16035 [Peptococcaceae bacterium]|nr:hypothetical protein [Peptococcaceae bacterium]